MGHWKHIYLQLLVWLYPRFKLVSHCMHRYLYIEWYIITERSIQIFFTLKLFQYMIFHYREKYPDFLPRTDRACRRDYVLEMLHRRDMFRRRQNLSIPEFYVGKYLAIYNSSNSPLINKELSTHRKKACWIVWSYYLYDKLDRYAHVS